MKKSLLFLLFSAFLLTTCQAKNTESDSENIGTSDNLERMELPKIKVEISKNATKMVVKFLVTDN